MHSTRGEFTELPPPCSHLVTSPLNRFGCLKMINLPVFSGLLPFQKYHQQGAVCELIADKVRESLATRNQLFGRRGGLGHSGRWYHLSAQRSAAIL